MNLSKKTEQEILKVYESWLSSFLNGDVDTYDMYLDEAYHFIGSTIDEEFLNRKDTTNFFEATAGQFSGKTELRNETRVLEQFGELVFITHLFDAWFLNAGEWSYYGRFRFSSTLQEKKEGWRFIYQHCSTTDSNVEKGETIGYAKVNEENLRLRQAIKRRTIELEAKNRELEIEAALEHIRAEMMSMHKSTELREVISSIFTQLQNLGFTAPACSIVIYQDDLSAKHWFAGFTDGAYPESYTIPYVDVPYYTDLLRGWQQQVEYEEFVMKGDEKVEYAKWLLEHTEFKHLPSEFIEQSGMTTPRPMFFGDAYMRYGTIETIGDQPLENEKVTILKRFAKVFEQTYTRFLDLQTAEAQTREAQIEAGLERVRARTMAIQKQDDLLDVITLLADQLVQLGINLDSANFSNGLTEKDMDIWIYNRYFQPGMQTSRVYYPWIDHPIFHEVKALVENYKKGIDWNVAVFSKADLGSFVDYVFTDTAYKDAEDAASVREEMHKMPGYTWSAICLKDTWVSMNKFDSIPFTDEQNAIFRRFAVAFGQAYTRFLDVQLKEEQAMEIAEEKKRLEATLRDLRATQKQLIHSEKMASLGELTAGIAHEIQNPLNFVNNFSEVSNELMDEMNSEIEKGDLAEARAIAVDIKQNLEKITQHGKRADAIVKGMLQHSRSSTSVKEPTDINKLIDEYVRLAYHGLRAKDKSFNVTLENHLDANLEKIDIIPQDIGRVILNIFTNACYAAHEKKSKISRENGEEDYHPTVTVRTTKTNNNIVIVVRDNGLGIPQSAIDKIFQPFYTTKPTGEGTGLGLSMSYDIVHAHNGDIKVESDPGVYTEFSIVLPSHESSE